MSLFCILRQLFAAKSSFITKVESVTLTSIRGLIVILSWWSALWDIVLHLILDPSIVTINIDKSELANHTHLVSYCTLKLIIHMVSLLPFQFSLQLFLLLLEFFPFTLHDRFFSLVIDNQILNKHWLTVIDLPMHLIWVEKNGRFLVLKDLNCVALGVNYDLALDFMVLLLIELLNLICAAIGLRYANAE